MTRTLAPWGRPVVILTNHPDGVQMVACRSFIATVHSELVRLEGLY